MESHVKVIAILYIVIGVIGALFGIFLFTVIAGGGLLSGDSEAIAVTSTVGTIIGGLFLVLSIPDIIAGIGLFKFKEWARIVTIILGILNLPGIPIGTALGIYTLVILFKPETIALFNPSSQTTPTLPAAPPPPGQV